MADRDIPIQQQTSISSRHGGLSTTSVLYASLAGLFIGGPLLCITGLIFFATSAFLILISPLLLIISPLLFLAGVVITFSLLGFAIAVGMAVAGLSAIGWTIKNLNLEKVGFGGGISGDPIKGVVDQGRDWAGYLQTKVGQDSLNVNRG
ncbi:hypothetical protein QQ045_013244 [Rhodiola kirilowii]